MALNVKALAWKQPAIERNGPFPSRCHQRPHALRDLFNWRPIKLLSDEISNKIINPDGLHSLQRRISISAINTFNLKEKLHQIFNKLTRSPFTAKFHISLLKQSVKGTSVQLATWSMALDLKAPWKCPTKQHNRLAACLGHEILQRLRYCVYWLPSQGRLQE